jgi:glycosyltransferase involved in cell wall biosynthesis
MSDFAPACPGPLRIGFGPITPSNSFHQSGRKVARVLEEDPWFTCGFFSWEPFKLKELEKFDVLIFIKYIPEANLLSELKRQGKRLLLDYHDTFLYPSAYETNPLRRFLKRIYYLREDFHLARTYRMLDGCLYASPLLQEVLEQASIRPLFLPRQIYNDHNEKLFKSATKSTSGVVIYWTGVGLNQVQNEPILPALKRLQNKYRCRIIYDTDTKGDNDWIDYHPFNPETWDRDMLEADIAFRWRDTSNLQRFKDANKILSYMAAGLPAVVYPTESEKHLVRDGETGFFAHSVEEFEQILERLILDPSLRARVGRAAHHEVWSRFSLRRHVDILKSILLQLSFPTTAEAIG